MNSSAQGHNASASPMAAVRASTNRDFASATTANRQRHDNSQDRSNHTHQEDGHENRIAGFTGLIDHERQRERATRDGSEEGYPDGPRPDLGTRLLDRDTRRNDRWRRLWPGNLARVDAGVRRRPPGWLGWSRRFPLGKAHERADRRGSCADNSSEHRDALTYSHVAIVERLASIAPDILPTGGRVRAQLR
ncbi:hypothetical protein [Dactylosporangium salmoneum]